MPFVGVVFALGSLLLLTRELRLPSGVVDLLGWATVASLALFWTIALFSLPKLLIPPPLRDQSSALKELIQRAGK
ncbi:hypothetical protein HJD18_13585 [Thermoleophilia bacterium SCSIO 60948]|nr:hypothetical protein HJD18_13585 [Thermoleophilia bacterium SCSIO 60948]